MSGVERKKERKVCMSVIMHSQSGPLLTIKTCQTGTEEFVLPCHSEDGKNKKKLPNPNFHNQATMKSLILHY